MNISTLYSKVLVAILLLSLLLGAFLIRFRQFQGCGFFRDEPGTNTLSYRSVYEYFQPEHGADPIEINGLFYYKFIQHPWQEFTGRILHDDTVFTCRLSSLLGALIGLAVFFQLGKNYTDKYTALLATALLTVNGCHQFYSNYLRYHIFSILAAILLTCALGKILSKPNWQNWFIYHCLTVINIYTSLNNLTLLPAHWLIIYLYTCSNSEHNQQYIKLRRGLITSALLSLLAFLPMPFWDSQALGRMSAYPPLSINLYLNIYCCLVGLKEYLLHPTSLITLISIAAFLAIGLKKAWQDYRIQNDLRLLTISAWLIVPLITHWIISLIVQPLIITRNLIFIMPAFALLVSVGIKSLANSTYSKVILITLWLIIIPTLLSQCGHNVFYEWDEPINPRYYRVPMSECCRYPGDHISGQLPSEKRKSSPSNF